ncbi:amino acid adenylation domain-containing protein, partial [Paenibacillus forsythiae]
ERANRLARTLRDKGVRADEPVAIMAERSLEMVVGIYAILKAGGAYMPIDPDYPEERIRYMLEDSGTRLLVVQRHLRERTAFAGTVVDLNEARSYHEDGSNLERASGADDLAYVIYTSGSTGKPKGVMIEHRPVINRLLWMQSAYPIGSGDTILQKTAITFDVSVWELFWWTLAGARMCLLPHGGEKNPELLMTAIENYGVTTMHFVPAMLHAFLEFMEGQPESVLQRRLRTLRQVFASGEALLPAHVTRFHRLIAPVSGARLINLYGPTEATVDVSHFLCQADQEHAAVPIGKPISNTHLYILPPGSAHQQPIGVPGELCIAGDGLARGYLNRPELTAEKFVDNPFVPGERMYRTGDLARWLPDGNIEYMGRIDHQVKIRGYRIELGEIEAQLANVESVREAVVIAREAEDGQKHLCAYFAADRELTGSELREALSQSLPGYMIPAYFVQLERMPLTPNGKIDRKALPAPEGHLQTGTEYVAARTPVEEALVQIWQEILGLSKVGVKDNFFEIGGHSLKVLQLIQKIHVKLEVDVPMRIVLESQTIEKMTEELLKLKFQQFERKNSYNIMKLNENGMMNVFCFPPILGYGIAFAEMAKHLENHCVVYALEFIENARNRSEMLDQYVDAIVSVQEKAPYVFIGYSAGGNLAFEVAKAMEERGYEVSDIIMIDSKKKNWEMKNAEVEIDDQIIDRLLLKHAPEPYKQVLTVPITRDKVINKIHAYHMFLSELINTGAVQAEIHGLVAEGSEVGRASDNDILLWKQATQKHYAEYEVIGEHLELLAPGYVEKNVKLIQRIVKGIIKQTERAPIHRKHTEK